MKVTIIRTDNTVYIDGQGYIVDCSGLSNAFRIMQWDGTKGHLEFDNSAATKPKDYKGNETITDIEEFQSVIDAALAIKHTIENPPPIPLPDYAARKRKQKEIGGFVSPNFGPLATDRETASILGDIVQSLDKGLVQAPVNFKGPNGFVSLTKEQITAIAGEVARYVQDCFNLEMTILQDIESGDITTYEQIDTAFATV